ncbi:MAG: hypothetical protein JO211_14190 [Acidobacteriaceae bacterium]|nr:hypothetical protein [Acidobacteriaceae bacterium]
MDVKQYYRKMREIENTLTEKDVLVMSLETPDGGKAGVLSEVSREVAAKLMVEGRAVLATAEEKQAYVDDQANARKLAHKAELARRLQVAIIADSDFENIAGRQPNGDLERQK